MVEIKNAKIQSVRLGVFERFRGAQICFDYGGSSQCTYFSAEKIYKLLKVLKLPFWESLPTTNCRVEASDNQIYKIGHYLNDEWFEI